MRRPLIWSLVALLLGSWLVGSQPARTLAAAKVTARGEMEAVRFGRSSMVFLHKSDETVSTYVAPPPPSGYLRAQAATIAVEYVDFPPEARAAFQYAVEIWQGLLTTPVPITVVAYWEPLDEDQLGGAAPVNGYSNFENAPQRDTFYPSGLANKLAGSDLAPDEPDIEAVFNSALGEWYFGTGQTPANRLNFVSTVVHELGHGLGFSGTARVVNGTGQWGNRGLPRTYDRFVVNGAGAGILDTSQFPNPSVALAQQLQGNNLFWNGGNGVGANGGNRPKLFAPSTWQQGSSYAHLDERTYPAGSANSLMTPLLAAGETVYNPGPIALGMLADMGWAIVGGPGPGAPAQTCFKETGKCIKGRFAQYWAANGGLAQQGFPLTDEFDEINPTDGKTYKTQYFERARFELHPENAPPYDVLLGLLGREQLAKYGGTPPAPMPNNPLGSNCAAFQQTGKRVCGFFLQYWTANGGLAQQGLPLTDIFLETNPTNGKQYPTQYFERARFEYHVGNEGTPYVVLLGLLGREQFLAKYPSGVPAPPPPSASPSPSVAPSPRPSPSTSPSPPPAGWGPTLTPLAGGQTYADPGGRFNISIPGSWRVLDTDDGLAIFGIADPLAECGAATDRVTASTTLAALDQAIDEVNGTLPSYQQLAKDKVLVRGVPAYRRIISYKLDDGTPVQEAQAYFVTGGSLALILCTTLPPQFAGYAATFDGIAGSMKLPTMAIVAAPSSASTPLRGSVRTELRALIARMPGMSEAIP